MSSVTDIANMALGHLEIAKEINDWETEQTGEARAVRRYYETTRDTTLADFPWPFATRIATLALVATDPVDEWGYSYCVGSDVLALYAVRSGVMPETWTSRVPFRLLSDTTGLLLYTNQELATVEYTVRVTDPAQFPANFVEALAYKLAVKMARRLAKGNARDLVAENTQAYLFTLNRAWINAARGLGSTAPTASEFERARD
jgi:hypothetical protein